MGLFCSMTVYSGVRSSTPLPTPDIESRALFTFTVTKYRVLGFCVIKHEAFLINCRALRIENRRI